jgi:UDP-glucose 4-epimerase
VAKSVVIGANGFLGSHLVNALVGAGHDVTAFDRFSTSTPTFRPGPRVLAGDFLNRADIDGAVAGQDHVFHFLSTTTPVSAEGDPTMDIRTNLAATVELIESCVAAEVGHVYFASTGGAMYGLQARPSYRETDRALPISPYGIGKLSVEHYLHYFARKFGLASTALRISNPYGPGQRPNRRQGFIPIALRQLAMGLPIVRFGDGSMERDYLYVDDLVAMVLPMVGAPLEHDLYNIGSGRGHTISDVLQAIASVTGRDPIVEERSAPTTFVDRVVLDIGRYNAEFPLPGMTSLEEGIARTWAEIEAQRG